MCKNQQKFEHLLQSAKTLFWKYGIRRVSIEEICREADVSKMTFYKHFKDKNSLVRTIVDGFRVEGMAKYKAIMTSSEPFPEKVEALLRLKLEQTELLSEEFFLDLTKHADPEVTGYLKKVMEDNIQLLVGDLVKAQKRGNLRSGISPEFIAYMMNKMIDMFKDENLLKLYPKPQAAIMELTRLFFYGILPAEGKNRVRTESAMHPSKKMDPVQGPGSSLKNSFHEFFRRNQDSIDKKIKY